ncbi:MAG: hypothetical protein JWP09_878 [Candidatus Taylorbacteria bacterium]|nr:hypothetical protein [Candidatus Taylorbacteria bacterium]
MYDQKNLEFHNQKVSVKKQIKDLETTAPQFTLEPVKKIFMQANTSQNEFLIGNDDKRHNVVKELLWNLSMKDKNMASIKYKSPFDVIARLPKNADFSTLCAH